MAFLYGKLRAETPPDQAGLVSAVVGELGQDATLSSTLPPAAYISPGFFELERKLLLVPGWIAVAHLCLLGRPDDCSVELFGERVTVAGDEAGVIVTGHASDGSSRAIRHEVLFGFIYVNLSGDAEPLAPQLAGLAPRLDRLRLEDVELAFRMDYDLTFNWKILLETFMECYHHIAAHPATFESRFPARLAGVGEHGDLWTCGYSQARDDVPEEELLNGLPLLATDFSDFERRSFFLYHIYPNQIIATTPDAVVWFRNQPESSSEAKLQVFMFVRSGASKTPGYDEIIAAQHAFFTQVNDEDIAANESQQLGLVSRMALPGRFSHLEDSLWHFATYIRQRMAAAA